MAIHSVGELVATLRADDRLSSAMKTAGQATTAAAGHIAAGVAAITAGVGAATAAAVVLAKRGGEVAGVARSFDALAARAGQSGKALLSETRSMTQGLVSDFDIMASANKGFLLGLPITASEMGVLGQSAIALGQAMNVGPEQALSDLITGLGRGSAAILDNLGITVKAEDAYAKYAASLGKKASALTEAEKKTAIYTSALKAAKEATETVGGIQLTTAQRLQQAQTMWKNLYDQVARIVAESPALNAFFTGAVELLSSLTGAVEDNESTLRTWVNDAAVLAATALVMLAKGATYVVDAWTTLKVIVLSMAKAWEIQSIWAVAAANALRHPTKAVATMKQAWEDTKAAGERWKKQLGDAVDENTRLQVAVDKGVKALEAFQGKVETATTSQTKATATTKQQKKAVEDLAAAEKALTDAYDRKTHTMEIQAEFNRLLAQDLDERVKKYIEEADALQRVADAATETAKAEMDRGAAIAKIVTEDVAERTQREAESYERLEGRIRNVTSAVQMLIGAYQQGAAAGDRWEGAAGGFLAGAEQGAQTGNPYIAIGMGIAGAISGYLGGKEGEERIARENALSRINEHMDAANAILARLEEIRQRTQEVVSAGAQGLAAMFENATSPEDFERLGRLGLAGVQAMRDQGFSMLEIFRALRPALDAARERLEELGRGPQAGRELATGEEGTFLTPFEDLLHFDELIQANEGLIASIEGTGAVLTMLRETGNLTGQNLTDILTQVGQDYDALIAQGFTHEQALAVQADSLRELNRLHEEGLITLDETTLARIRDAEAAGLLDPTPQERMKEILDLQLLTLVALADMLGATLPQAVREYIDSLSRIPRDITTNVHLTGGGGGGEGGGKNEDESEGFASGTMGFRDFGRGTPAMLHGEEGVFTRDQMDRIIANAVRGGGGEPGAGGGGVNVYVAVDPTSGRSRQITESEFRQIQGRLSGGGLRVPARVIAARAG